MIQGAKEKLEGLITQGRGNVETTFAGIQKEFEKRQDVIAKPSVIDYSVTDDGICPVVQGETYRMTEHSSSQIFYRTGVPAQYAHKLLELGEHGLLRNNLKTMTDKVCKDGILLGK